MELVTWVGGCYALTRPNGGNCSFEEVITNRRDTANGIVGAG